jgi:diguanylate cyclase (GGDEF)-like protein/PAS domain S-box-containing protein
MTSNPLTDAGPNPELLRAAIVSAANAIFITNREGEIEWANPAFERLTGYTLAEASGRTPRILKSGNQPEALYRDLWKTVLSGRVWRGRVVNRHKSGHLYTAEQTITPIGDEAGSPSHFVAIHEDITARLASEAKVAHMALHDYLTGLPNRYALDQRLELELQRSRRLGNRVGALWVDLDNFKDINDTFGHSFGDNLLVAVGERLTRVARGVDLTCRLGGDEFAIVMPDIAERSDIANLAERIVRSLSEPFRVEKQEIFIGASIGATISDQGVTSRSEFTKQADLALYTAKEDGRSGYRFFESGMDLRIQRRMKLGQDLHRALVRDEFFLEYQPQVELSGRRVVGTEALVRWRHPRLGIVPPREFIPVAESSGLIEAIGDWVLEAACGQARDWLENDALPSLPVAVNISAVQLRDPDFAERVTKVLLDKDLPPEFLELELTERVLMDGSPRVERTLRRLHESGVHISLDDFGKGYASLDYLRRYPLSKVKIDQSFVRDMETNVKNAAIVRAVIDLASKLKLTVIAEGVEPEDLLRRLVAEGCEQVQGFYFSRPLSPKNVEELLTVGSDRVRGNGPVPSSR